jgi:hypothetical protein
MAAELEKDDGAFEPLISNEYATVKTCLLPPGD